MGCLSDHEIGIASLDVSDILKDSGYDQPTSEPSVSLPDCPHNSCEDIEDKETLDAPGFALVTIPCQTRGIFHTE